MAISVPDPTKPLTRKQLREACADPFVQTRVKLKSKWTAPLKYKVLQVFQLSDKDRREVSKMLVKATTPSKAKELVMKSLLANNDKGKNYWSYRDITILKDFDCGVLQFKGLAVCLYYRRQVNEIEPVATDPVPIGALENEDDIYARLDLFSKSPRQLVSTVREELLELSMQVEELKHSVAVRDIAIENLQKQLVVNNPNPKRRTK